MCILFFMRYLILLILMNLDVYAKPIKIGVIDTGFSYSNKHNIKFCKNEHFDATGTSLNDINGHGTNIIGLISNNISNFNYCIVIIKFFNNNGGNSLSALIKSLRYALSIKVNILNLSLGGYGFSQEEKTLISKILDSGTSVVAAAGNDRVNLDVKCSYYPACYDKRIHVIGNTSLNSNYGTIVDFKIDGNKKQSLGITLSGSSQSTAIFTNFLIRDKLYAK